MHVMKHPNSLLLLPAVIGLSLTSCVVSDYPVRPSYSNAGASYGTYTVLPRNYSGDAYYHGGRYYSGGRYESGTFHDRGQTYSNRYYHDGRYYYGVRHESHKAQQPSQRHDNGGDDHDHGRQERPRSSPYQQLPHSPRYPYTERRS